MKRYLLSLLIIVGMFIITCGEKPPDEYYEGTPEDSAAIFALLDNNPELLLTIDGFIDTYIALQQDGIAWPLADSFFKGDSTTVKQQVDSCALQLSDSTRFTDLWFTKDTTCTVYIIDTFTVLSLMHYVERQTGYYFYNGDTMTDLDTVMVDPTAGDDDKEITGEGVRHIFFEPKKEADVDLETGDTVWVIIEPIEWELKKISYGAYYYPNRGGDIPTVGNVVLEASGGEPDTIVSSSSDSLPGHAMNRLRSIDSLLTYADGETLSIDVTIYTPTDVDSASFYASCNGAGRVELPRGSGDIVLTGSGIVNLYVEVVVDNGYVYVLPDKGYDATVWLIPINIGGTQ